VVEVPCRDEEPDPLICAAECPELRPEAGGTAGWEVGPLEPSEMIGLSVGGEFGFIGVPL